MMLGGCATRPINPPIEQVDLSKGYRFDTRWAHRRNYDAENLVVLAFSGGGTRAAAFSYGVLETLRRMEVVGPKGRKFRMLDEVDLVTGVSGGSFTALAYRPVRRQAVRHLRDQLPEARRPGRADRRALNPGNWGALSSENWGRSELAAQFYDEILFHGATYADLDRGTGPLILASATDISTGARLGFTAIALRLPLLGPERGTALPRCRGIVGRAVRTFAGDAQQLWRQLQVRCADMDRGIRQSRDCAAACRPRPQDTRRTCRRSRMASTGRTSISWTAAWPTTSACAPCSRCWRLLEALKSHGSADAARPCAQGHLSSSSIRVPRRRPTGTRSSVRPATWRS